jgi:NitT/TauT family transport system ATP-binding protein
MTSTNLTMQASEPTSSISPSSRAHALLELRDVSHSYGKPGAAGSVALHDVTFEVGTHEFISLIGPSGCGKSTLLRLIAGLIAPKSGTVAIDGQPVKGMRRDVGFVFQRDALLPWRSVTQNVQLALKFRNTPRSETREQASVWLAKFGLTAHADKYPHQLSGGQRKRVALAATLIYQPRLLLMDEPFSALDVQTRDIIENDILRAWAESENQTVVFVTHDLEEAVALSDRVLLISNSPGTVIGDYKIDLPRPRDLLDVRTEPRFRELHSMIWEHLRTEVVTAAQRELGATNATQ